MREAKCFGAQRQLTAGAPPPATTSPPTSIHWPALGLGAFFASVTGFVLFKDVIDGAPVTTAHVLALAGLVAALATGHMAVPQFKRVRIASGLTLGLLFVAATGYTVISAASRNSETAHGKVEAANQAAADRRRAEGEYKAAVAELVQLDGVRSTQQVRAAMDVAKINAAVFRDTRQCTDVVPGSGEHRACKPILDLRQEMAGAIRKGELEAKRDAASAKLARLPAVVAGNTGYRDAARVLAAAGLVSNVERTTESLALLLPFLIVLVTEGCTIAFLHIGLPNAPADRRTVREAPTTPAEPSGTTRAPSAGARLVRAEPSARLDKQRACADLLTRLALGQSVPAQDELARSWGRPKSTVSDWLREWEGAGLIPARRTVGRRKVLERA